MVLEIYALYILPRTQGWDRTKVFIDTTSYLDQERRELFLQQLESLRKEQEEHEREARRKQKVKNSSRAESDKGSVISQQHLGSAPNIGNGHLPGSTRGNDMFHAAGSKANSASSKNSITSRQTRSTSNKLSVQSNPTGSLINYIQSCILAIGTFLRINPFFYLRTLLFLVALLLSLTRGEFRERIKRITATGWGKLRDTVGMGVKVTSM